jgi:hypothetical protein
LEITISSSFQIDHVLSHSTPCVASAVETESLILSNPEHIIMPVRALKKQKKSEEEEGKGNVQEKKRKGGGR